MIKMERKEMIAALLCTSIAMSMTACSETKETEEETEETTVEETTTEETTTSEETTTVEETTTTEETTTALPAYSGDEYQAFLDGLNEAVANGQMYYEDVEGVTGSMTLYLMDNGYDYMYTDLDGDGQYELMIGGQWTSGQDGSPLIMVNGFVDIDADGNYNIMATTAERSNTEYLGNGYFITEGSGGADLHIQELYHYDADTDSLVIVAQLVTDYLEDDADGIPIPEYSLYEGCEWSYSVSDRACNDSSAAHGEDAEHRWEELMAEANGANELIGATWNNYSIGEEG